MRVCPLLGAILSAGIGIVTSVSYGQFPLVTDGKVTAEIFVDQRGAKGEGVATLDAAGEWLAACMMNATKYTVAVTKDAPGDSVRAPYVVIARRDSYPHIANKLDGKSTSYGEFSIVSTPSRLYLLGNSEAAARHAVATLLRHLGFRWYAPSPQWHHTPNLDNTVVRLNRTEKPRLVHRGIWYAYAGGDKVLMDNYRRWAIANRLSVRSIIRTGHSYGNIINRNQPQFAEHPEYYALLPDGTRDNQRAVNARKFCFSNAGLIDLVAKDRAKLLTEYQKANEAAFMVSLDPSDGEGTCHCNDCQALGTTTDRVLHLANGVAKRLREQQSDAWVGLYAYSSHRLPPTIQVESNVYIQVAMGFNRTQYTLPELVERWSSKVGAVGLREYYGVEAWDWGLPGRMRGAHVAYHRRWIPYYVERKLNAINAETNANWGAQTLGLYVASQLMWDPTSDVDQLVEEFYSHCYGDQAGTLKRLMAKFDESPPLRSATILPMFQDVAEAWQRLAQSKRAGRDNSHATVCVERRLTDLMAYLVYVAKFREFDLVRNRQATRDTAYYDALLPLMNYTWRIRERDMVHHYALARRLCNGLPVKDERLDFYMFNKEQSPVWMKGDSLNDQEIHELFVKTLAALQRDGSPVVTYSRYLDSVRVSGEDVGPSRQFLSKEDGVATFRSQLTGYIVPGAKQLIKLRIAPTGRAATFTVFLREDTILFEETYKGPSEFVDIEFELPKANEYRFRIQGGAKLAVPPGVPLVFEASVSHPAWIDYSGPQYFYVPKGAKQLIVDANPRLSLFVPGEKAKRIDVSSATREPKRDYTVIDVPEGAAGQVWHTGNQTRGKVMFLNVPPLLSFHRHTTLVPREVGEGDGLTTEHAPRKE